MATISVILKTIILLTLIDMSLAADAGSSSQQLSVGAAVGISVAVSVVVCAVIACIIICLLVRYLRPGRRDGAALAGDGNHFEQQYTSASGSRSLLFVEEGSGATANAGLDPMRHKSSKHQSKDKEYECHKIAVKVASPDDLRFKVCRSSEGAILVATDPAAGSKCSRDGIREGDQIIGVYVDIKSAGGGAHPKEVSELLSLASDYPLVVEFAHSGPVVRGPSADNPARRSKLSSAEAVLRRHRNRQSAVDVVDGPSTEVTASQQIDEQPQERQRQSRKLWSAPPPPEDRDSHFSIQDRRKRRRKQQLAQTTDTLQEEPQPWFERLCSLHSEAKIDDGEWVWMPNAQLVVLPESDVTSESEADEQLDDTALIEEQAIAVFSASLMDSAPRRFATPPAVVGLVERVFDHYELEEQDVVPDMPPPSELRPVIDSCTQYDGAESQMVDSCELEEVWESLQNHVVWPELAGWQSLPNCKVQGQFVVSVPVTEEDEDRELAVYLASAAVGVSSSSASSSSRTIQEDAMVATVAPSAQCLPPRQRSQEDQQLLELSRSMALRDVEVATVILLDAEARRRQQMELEGDHGELSSGRSTVQEECIDPILAPDRKALSGDQVERDLRNLMHVNDSDSADEDQVDDEDLAVVEALIDDFELAAAEWKASHSLNMDRHPEDTEDLDTDEF